ncbi:MAG: MFS transporter [Tissierellia bacterium]|nr:MFS transporter [Tissierellia bacterium]
MKSKNVRYNSKINVLNGAFQAIAINLTNPYLAKFAQRLGGGNIYFALMTSIPYFVGFFSYVPSSIMIESIPDKQRTIGITMFLQKMFFLAIALVPFFGGNKALLYIIFLGFMNLFQQISNMGYQSFIADVFPPIDRVHTMGSRSSIASIIGMIVIFVGGRLLSLLPKDNNNEIIKMYQVLFILAFIASLIELFFFSRFRYEKSKKKKKENSLSILKTVLNDIPNNKKFLSLILASSIFHIGWMGAQPLFTIKTIEILKATEGWISAISIVSAISSFIFYPQWAKFAERKGNAAQLTFSILLMGIAPIAYALCTNLLQLTVFNVVLGAAASGTILALFNFTIEVVPNKNRTIYIAVYNTIIAVVAAVSPLIFTYINEVSSINVALITAAFFRFIANFFFKKVRD